MDYFHKTLNDGPLYEHLCHDSIREGYARSAFLRAEDALRACILYYMVRTQPDIFCDFENFYQHHYDRFTKSQSPSLFLAYDRWEKEPRLSAWIASLHKHNVQNRLHSDNVFRDLVGTDALRLLLNIHHHTQAADHDPTYEALLTACLLHLNEGGGCHDAGQSGGRASPTHGTPPGGGHLENQECTQKAHPHDTP